MFFCIGGRNNGQHKTVILYILILKLNGNFIINYNSLVEVGQFDDYRKIK